MAARQRCPDCRRFDFHVHPERFNMRFKEGDIVFVEDVGDAFGDWVPAFWIFRMLEVERANPGVDFLHLTKNPGRYFELSNFVEPAGLTAFRFPGNAILGATIESNRDYGNLSKAPPQGERLRWMARLAGGPNRLFVSVEPVLDFDLDEFAHGIREIKPWAVAVGYDNYSNRLPEPGLEKTAELIGLLEGAGIRVYRKTLRGAWWERRACGSTRTAG